MKHETESLKDWVDDNTDINFEKELYGFEITKEMNVIIDSLRRIEQAIGLMRDKHMYQQYSGDPNGN
ncbi:MAG: hypothetical protein CL489_00845 [Acidobacteria bacterium]|nr:hypothetical protein [Acidobacteriota bacterium]